MHINQIREQVGKVIKLSKDGSATQGEKTYSYVTFNLLKEALSDALPKGVSYSTAIRSHHPENGNAYNSILGGVFYDAEQVHEESVNMPLYQNPFDAAGAITMLKKSLIMSMFDLVPDEGNDDKLELSTETMGALVKIASEEGFVAAMHKGSKHFQMTPKAIETLRKASKKK